MFLTRLSGIGIVTVLLAVTLAVYVFIVEGTDDMGRTTGRVTMSKLRPDVTCSDAGCIVRVVVLVDDRRLFSDPLPFSAVSAETVTIPADSSFGLGNPEGRLLTAWAIGRGSENGRLRPS